MVGCVFSQLKTFFTAKNVEFFIFDVEQSDLMAEKLGELYINLYVQEGYLFYNKGYFVKIFMITTLKMKLKSNLTLKALN